MGSSPNSTYSRNDSQETLSSSKRTESQITIIESGYNSADEQRTNHFRPNSGTIIEESPPNADFYEQFVDEYLSRYAKYSHSNDDSFILSIDEQQIPITRKHVSSTSSKNLCLEALNQYPLPFETESNQLVIFISDEPIVLQADHWLYYRTKYNNVQWIKKLKRVNRHIPTELIPIIEQWLAEHATLSLSTNELNIDGLTIPLIGRLGLHLLDLHSNRSLAINYWNEIFKYLIRIGYVSYDSNQQVIHIANSELDARRILTSSSKIECDTKKVRLTDINDDQIQILIQWLQKLNHEKFITITEQNDIIIFVEQDQQIFIHHNDVKTYMNTRKTEVVNMNDIAHILLLYNYVQYSSGQLTFGTQRIQLDTNELLWLQSIIGNIRLIEQSSETEVELFDGEQTQILRIPYEYMTPTNDSKIVADYLFRNGNVRYDDETGNYAYRYVTPNIPLRERINSDQHQLLSSHIHQIHIDEDNQRIDLEFFHNQNNYLQLPSSWYHQALEHHFDRSYIIDMLLTNGGILTQDNFTFNGQSYSFQTPISNLSSKEKEDLINNYVEHIHNQDGIKYDQTNHLLLLENPSDGSQLFLTREHTQFIHQNQYRRQDVKHLLVQHSEIKQDQFGNYLLYYNNQFIQIPLTKTTKENVDLSKETETEFLDRYYAAMDSMYNHGLITSNKRLRFIQIHFSNQILTIPIDQLRSIIDIKILHSTIENILPFNSRQLSQWLLKNSDRLNNSPEGFIQLTYKKKFYNLPLINSKKRGAEKLDPKLKLLFPFNKSLRLIQKTASSSTLDIEPSSDYTIDPLLILANYIYRAGTIYQDELGRLIIKMNEDEIVVPRIEAINAIETINISPKRTGTIIARLIHRLGKIQSNQAGGLIIAIGKRSFELSKENIDHANQPYIDNNLLSQNRDLNRSSSSIVLPLLRHSRSASSLLSSGLNHDEQTLYSKDGRGDARYLNLDYKSYIGNDRQKSVSIDDLTRLNPERSNKRTSLSRKPCILVILDDETISFSNRQARFYVQYVPEDAIHTRMSSSQHSAQLISPDNYQDIELREAPVYIREKNQDEIFYENLAQYLSSEYPAISSRTVRHMLKFSSRNEYLAYLSKKMSSIDAKQFVEESEDNYRQRSVSPGISYNVQNGKTIIESNNNEEQQQQRGSVYNFSSSYVERSSSTSTLSSDMLIANTLPSRRTNYGNTFINDNYSQSIIRGPV
jgi:hypothetical protein